MIYNILQNTKYDSCLTKDRGYLDSLLSKHEQCCCF